ncbi:hypothetical protein Svir_28430 [Saccharomonospora viridis DSM 43017]|uniref:Uncharacterized protein n=1 Tax=Saccharomonospora viridis (strain ATCC 15386 / DSM 43017 / JCM 3036 / CCUG 5913 / NBRC 12207 / NCIMB 9602 / P101) TaxID=471857 RepID=C7MW55_SACVD|nr:hypothetical protein Svir_28430 [Saccharomonospora viridis DSM 43017]
MRPLSSYSVASFEGDGQVTAQGLAHGGFLTGGLVFHYGRITECLEDPSAMVGR